jgi:hypothetical protein
VNDLQTLRDAFEFTPPAAREEARAALLERAAPRRRRRSRRPAALVAALALVAAVVAIPNNRDVPGVVEPASARVLERAAQAAQQQPQVEPRDNQWIYTLDAHREQWKRVDGRGWAIRDDRGEIQVEIMRGKPRAPLDGYKQQAALPTDPRRLLDWAYAQTDSIEGAGTTADAEVYAVLRGLLNAGILPPGLAAATFRAIKEIPGVTVGREGALLAVTLTDGGLRQSLLLDATTYAYAGQRAVKVGPTSKPGDGGTSMRLKTAIVDRPE